MPASILSLLCLNGARIPGLYAAVGTNMQGPLRYVLACDFGERRCRPRAASSPPAPPAPAPHLAGRFTGACAFILRPACIEYVEPENLSEEKLSTAGGNWRLGFVRAHQRTQRLAAWYFKGSLPLVSIEIMRVQ